jgi:hypothetical protein
VTEDNSEFAGLSDRALVIPASPGSTGTTSALELIRRFYIDQRELLLASVHILRIVGTLAWHREIARRRIGGWTRAFLTAPFSWELKRIEPDSCFCFRASGPRRASSDQEGSSMLMLLEDDTPLTAPHTAHDEIRRLGRGRYSHWGRYVYFSTSDNTDPRKNGRVYKLVRRM